MKSTGQDSLHLAERGYVFLFLSRESQRRRQSIINRHFGRSWILTIWREKKKMESSKGHTVAMATQYMRGSYSIFGKCCVFFFFSSPWAKQNIQFPCVRYIYWPINFDGLLVNWLNIIPPCFIFIFPLLISWSKRWVSCTWRRTCYTAMSAQGRSSSPDEVPGN